jgi:type II secretory pathway component GspD/PulD (secretin)
LRRSRGRKLDSSLLPVGPKYTGEPISVNLKDVDLKDFFRLIHEISGLNVVLDPNVHGTLTVVLDDVPWDQALDIVLKNNDLARELEGNVLRIATVDTLKKRSGWTARTGGSGSSGGGKSFRHPLPQLCPRQGCDAHREEVPLAAR